MAEPMSDERLADIEAEHSADSRGSGACAGCSFSAFENHPCVVVDLVAEVKRLRSTVDILWSTMNRDIKVLADEALEGADLPAVEGGYRA